MKRTLVVLAVFALAACSKDRATTRRTDQQPSETTNVRPQPAPSDLDPLIELVANRVIEGAALANLDIPFNGVAVGRSANAGEWQIWLDPDLASPFSIGDACQPRDDGAGVSLCHVSDGHTVCSYEGVATLLKLHAGHGCDADLLAADPVDANDLEGTPAALIIALAHELGHITLGHEGGAFQIASLVEGPTEQRLRVLGAAASSDAEVRAWERAADEFAAGIFGALLDRALADNEPQNRDYVEAFHINQLQTAMLCLDEVSSCRWINGVDVPALAAEEPDPGIVSAHALALICATLDAPEGAMAPTLRGTHGDWAARMGRYQASRPPIEDPFPDQPLLSALAASMSETFRFWARYGAVYSKALAKAVRVQVNDFDSTRCESVEGMTNAASACPPVEVNLGPATSSTLTWTSNPGARVGISGPLSGEVVAVDGTDSTIAIALTNPSRLATMDGAQTLVANLPCRPSWAQSTTGAEILIACETPGALAKVNGGNIVLQSLGEGARRGDDPVPVHAVWTGEIDGLCYASARFGNSSNSFVARWREQGLEEIGTGGDAGCDSWIDTGPYQLMMGADQQVVARPFDDPVRLYGLSPNLDSVQWEIEPSDWQLWALENDWEIGTPYSCRSSAHTGLRCMTDEVLWFDPARNPSQELDGRLSVDEQSLAELVDVDFCDSSTSRWVMMSKAEDTTVLRIESGTVQETHSFEDVSTARLWCGDSWVAVSVTDGVSSQVVVLE